MPIMVHEGLFVGPGADTYKFAGSILHCARDPWFRLAARLPKPEFEDWFRAEQTGPLFVRQSYNELALNMVDAAEPRYFSDEMVNAGLEFITERLAEGDAILVHCNMGLSRSPSMAFLWMFEHGFLDDEFRHALPQFKTIYPNYCPGNGIWQYLKRRCDK
jgi:hypothetical protein